MQLRPFKEILASSKEKLDEIRAPIRARAAKAKSEMYLAELEEKGANLESKLQDLVTAKELDFSAIADVVDEVEILEHRKERVTDIVAQLFPVEAA